MVAMSEVGGGGGAELVSEKQAERVCGVAWCGLLCGPLLMKSLQKNIEMEITVVPLLLPSCHNPPSLFPAIPSLF